MVKIFYTGFKYDVQPFIDRIQVVIGKLPDDIQQKIHKGCMIFIIDNCYGYYINNPQNNIILLNAIQIKNDCLSLKDQDYIIAHEFAHFILNHVKSSIKGEKEANILVDHWGFSKELQ